MLILGHIGITAFVASMIYLPAFGAIIGVLLPDVIDKGLYLLGVIDCSRFIAHNVFFFPIPGLIAYAVTRNRNFAIAISLGSTLHLVEDVHDFLPLLWPLKDYAELHTCGTRITLTPYIIMTELIGATLLVYIYGFSKSFLRMRREFWKLVRGK